METRAQGVELDDNVVFEIQRLDDRRYERSGAPSLKIKVSVPIESNRAWHRVLEIFLATGLSNRSYHARKDSTTQPVADNPKR